MTVHQAATNLQQVTSENDNGAQNLAIGHLTAIVRAQNALLLALADALQSQE